jgi:hypothetical protein
MGWATFWATFLQTHMVTLLDSIPGLPDFSWSKYAKMGTNYTKRPQIIPHGRKILQMVIKFPFCVPIKFTQIGILGFKINHLATLLDPTLDIDKICRKQNLNLGK